MRGSAFRRSTRPNMQSAFTHELDQLRAELDALVTHPKANQQELVLSIDSPRAGPKHACRRIRVGTVGSILSHTGLLLFILHSASQYEVTRSELIPISIETFGREEHIPETAPKSTPEGKLSLELSQESVEVAQTVTLTS